MCTVQCIYVLRMVSGNHLSRAKGHLKTGLTGQGEDPLAGTERIANASISYSKVAFALKEVFGDALVYRTSYWRHSLRKN